MRTGRSRFPATCPFPADQAWFFTPEWLAGEREADADIAAGRGTVHESAEDMFGHLDETRRGGAPDADVPGASPVSGVTGRTSRDSSRRCSAR